MRLGTFKLPSEAEWECACKAGSIKSFPWGNDFSYSQLGKYGWYDENSAETINYEVSSGATHPVGQRKPNAWGLYDMHGNVWEWCSDWFGEYSTESQTDPKERSDAPPLSSGPSDGPTASFVEMAGATLRGNAVPPVVVTNTPRPRTTNWASAS